MWGQEKSGSETRSKSEVAAEPGGEDDRAVRGHADIAGKTKREAPVIGAKSRGGTGLEAQDCLLLIDVEIINRRAEHLRGYFIAAEEEAPFETHARLNDERAFW